MPSEESRLIETLRVFCITAMMWVHVNPGVSSPSVVTSGDYALVGAVFGNTLGRVSVSLLSFISGYLLWQRAKTMPVGGLAMRRFRSVLVPMLVWSAIYILLALMKEPLTGVIAHKIEGLDLAAASLANAWAGITGPTANLSLFFLRDLFVASLALRLSVPLIERVPLVVAATVLVAATGDALQPLVFRASILQFLFFGALAARLGYTLTGLSRPLVALSLGYLLSVAGFAALRQTGNPMLHELDLPNLLRRAGVSFLILAFAAVLLARFPGLELHRAGRHAYLAYLMHVPVLGILWVVWRSLVGGADDRSYLLFFLAAPVVVFALAVRLGITLDRAPRVVQIALRGRIVEPAPGPASD
jgi:fucose 4-O-acetylase-like acetyltransferase